jgi:hypothetical protein
MIIIKCSNCNLNFIHQDLKTNICFDCIMASKIQLWWQYIYWNPKSKLCQKRLHDQYDAYNI